MRAERFGVSSRTVSPSVASAAPVAKAVDTTESALHVFYTVTQRWHRRICDHRCAVPLLGATGRRLCGCPTCGQRRRTLYLLSCGGIFACLACHYLAYETP